MRGGDLAPELDHAVFRAGQPEAAALFPAGGKPGLFLKRAIEFNGVFQQLRERCRRPKLSDEARRMPSGTRCEFALLQDHHIGLVVLAQVIGCGAANDATADHHILRLCGKCLGHVHPPNSPSNISRDTSKRS